MVNLVYALFIQCCKKNRWQGSAPKFLLCVSCYEDARALPRPYLWFKRTTEMKGGRQPQMNSKNIVAMRLFFTTFLHVENLPSRRNPGICVTTNSKKKLLLVYAFPSPSNSLRSNVHPLPMVDWQTRCKESLVLDPIRCFGYCQFYLWRSCKSMVV